MQSDNYKIINRFNCYGKQMLVVRVSNGSICTIEKYEYYRILKTGILNVSN